MNYQTVQNETGLTGTWNTSTVSSSRRTLHATVLPFLRAEDTTGADAELMATGEYCTSLMRFSATRYATSSVYPVFQHQQKIST